VNEVTLAFFRWLSARGIPASSVTLVLRGNNPEIAAALGRELAGDLAAMRERGSTVTVVPAQFTRAKINGVGVVITHLDASAAR
jgi:hypothetical protein